MYHGGNRRGDPPPRGGGGGGPQRFPPAPARPSPSLLNLTPDPNYWPQWETHYAPIEKNRNRIHHRNNFAPPPYSSEMPGPSSTATMPASQRPRRGQGLLDPSLPPVIPSSLRRAEAALSMPPAPYPNYQHGGFTSFSSSLRPVPLAVRCEVRSTETTIIWDTPTFQAREPANFRYVLNLEGGERKETIEFAKWKTRYVVQVSPGSYYKATVDAKTPENFVVGHGEAEFKAIFDGQELRETYNLALTFLRPLSAGKTLIDSMQPFQYFYRNKPTAYFDHVRLNDFGIMRKYRKDDNGHPASPINGEIEGLFFNARMPGGIIPMQSPFGNIRLTIPAGALFTPNHTLYFCDFYCNNKTHYITVVACSQDSPTDLYCRRYLMPLDPTNNVFLSVEYNPYTGQLQHYVNQTIWVEFYYTEDVPLSWGTFTAVSSTGQSRPNGLPNNKSCKICNLYPIPAVSTQQQQQPPTNRGVKRGASMSDEPRVENDRKRSSVDSTIVPTTSANFEPLGRRKRTTFHRAMESVRATAETEGNRLECIDPAVVEVVRSLVDEVVASSGKSEDEEKEEGELSVDFGSDGGVDTGYTSSSSAAAKTGGASCSVAEHGASSSLVVVVATEPTKLSSPVDKLVDKPSVVELEPTVCSSVVVKPDDSQMVLAEPIGASSQIKAASEPSLALATVRVDLTSEMASSSSSAASQVDRSFAKTVKLVDATSSGMTTESVAATSSSALDKSIDSIRSIGSPSMPTVAVLASTSAACIATSVSPEPPPTDLIDQELEKQLEALAEYTARKDAIQRTIKTLSDMINETKRSTGALCNKLDKLD